MKSRYSVLIVLFFFLSNIAQLHSQQRIDGSFAFKNVAKKYSLYIPSNYTSGSAAVLGFHPLNTARWNSISWRDTLIAFAEQNSVLLICPDGGSDGRVDDAIDTAFTTTLLDSVAAWYPYQKSTLIAMGFSWGGRTTYTYGLSHPQLVKGLIPIGAAIEGTKEILGLESNAVNKNIFIVHGSRDDLPNRFTPAFQLLNSIHCCLFDTILSGIDHTIDFPNRNAILSHAYQLVKNNVCLASDVKEINAMKNASLFPSHYSQGKLRIKNIRHIEFSAHLLSLEGKSVANFKILPGENSISLPLQLGLYYIIDKTNNTLIGKFVVR